MAPVEIRDLIAEATARINEWSADNQRPSDIGMIVRLRDALAALTTPQEGDARVAVAALRAHGLLSDGAPVQGNAKLLQNSAPSEEQIARVRRMLKPFGLGDACTDRDLRAAFAAAGVTPQEPKALDPEKVAEVIDRGIYGYINTQGIARALCEAYTEGKLTC